MFYKYALNVCIGEVLGNAASISCTWIKKLVALVPLVSNMETPINFPNFIHWRKFDYKSWSV